MFEDFIDFLYRNIHWILIGLLLIFFWRTLSENTFLILAIIVLIIGIMWDNWNKEQHVAEGFPVGKGPANHNRNLVFGRGLEGTTKSTITCPPGEKSFNGICIPKGGGYYPPSGFKRLSKPYCPGGTKPTENCRCYFDGVNPDGTCKPLCPSGTIPTKNCVCEAVDISTGKCIRI